MRLATSVSTIALAGFLGLAACTTPPATTGADTAAQASAKPDPGCEVHVHGGMIRPGDNIPAHMRVANTGHWCFSGITFDTSLQGSRIVDDAAHGDVRILVRNGGLFFGYRPKPGYVGGDSFIISVPGGFGYDHNLSVTVAVPP